MEKAINKISAREKNKKWRVKQAAEIRKEKLFLEVNKKLLDKKGRLKFGVDSTKLEKKWKKFKRDLKQMKL